MKTDENTCKQCKPHFETDAEGPYVELCSVHAMRQDRKEQRRYALLQAAATLTEYHCKPLKGSKAGVVMDVTEAIEHAEKILAEIEKRMMARKE